MRIIAGIPIGMCLALFLAGCAVYSSSDKRMDWVAGVVEQRAKAKAKKVTCATTMVQLIDGLTPCADVRRSWKPRAKRGRRKSARR